MPIRGQLRFIQIQILQDVAEDVVADGAGVLEVDEHLVLGGDRVAE